MASPTVRPTEYDPVIPYSATCPPRQAPSVASIQREHDGTRAKPFDALPRLRW